MTKNTQQATGKAQQAVNGEANIDFALHQYQLNKFLTDLYKLNKNIIPVQNVQMNEFGNGAYLGDHESLLEVMKNSSATDVVVSCVKFGQIEPEFKLKMDGTINDPNSIVQISLAFQIAFNQAITAKYQLARFKSALEQYNLELNDVQIINTTTTGYDETISEEIILAKVV